MSRPRPRRQPRPPFPHPLRYPPDLPVSERKDELAATIRDHQVVIVAGETGSGKSTQLPKICLELGRGTNGLIGHTQPRRIAARTVAERIAEEVGTPLGGVVGYTVRFTDRVGDDTMLKVMTDGILLAEIQRDRRLARYDTLIVDEAHERSLNIDFILGYLKQLLPRRPDLKVIVTSATIDTARFAEHFYDAPVVEVSGRTYPVEVRYRPVVDDAEDIGRDQTQAICDAIAELSKEGPGDVLVFLNGEREIRDTAEAVTAMRLPNTEILPLYARLSSAEQHRVFQRHPGRRVVLATNVAETSLTVPGVRYVVDAGTARISRYNRRTKVQRLPIEPVSQAAANQRAGRCGRVAPGICVRLYSEDDFASRPEFTEPEILRTNLASVILQMAAIGLGDVAAFPFIEPPDARNIRDGVALLEEIGALDQTPADIGKRLSPLGRRIAKLPVDPRLARMILEAGRNGCVREVMVIAGALSIQDPRERPTEKQQAADEMHRRFADPDSDFVAYLNLWDYLRDQQKALSSSQFRRLCKAEYLNYLRVREWQDIYSQLRQLAPSLDVHLNHEAADRDRIHMSLLAGLLSHVGLRDAERQEYFGARNARFSLSPGSGLFKKSPKWVMAAELVETTRLWARVAARIQPEWAERAGEHLVKRTYSDPEWVASRGAVMARETVTLYGIPIVTGRNVNYGRIDPVVSREMFIWHALVDGEWETHHRFVEHNRRLVDQVIALEHRVRRRELLVDDEARYAFYDERLPADVVSARHFDRWWKLTREREPALLDFTFETLLGPAARGIRLSDYPDEWAQRDLRLVLSYLFEPGSPADGVIVHIPLAVLNRVSPEGFDWHVPGLREELVVALIRSLPKPLRRHFVPVQEYARSFLDRARPGDGPLTDALGRQLTAASGERIPPDAWQLDRVPEHLRMTFRIEDDRGRAVATGKDLELLRWELQGEMRTAVAEAAGAGGVEQPGARSWVFGSIPRIVESRRGGHMIKAYPALVDEGETVALRLLATEAEQEAAMAGGTRRLLLLTAGSPAGDLQRRLSNPTKLVLARSPHGDIATVLADCIDAAVDRVVARNGGPAWDEEGFANLQAITRAQSLGAAARIVATATRMLAARAAIENRLDGLAAPAFADAVGDVRAQLGRLLPRRFASVNGAERLADVERYLQAVDRRLDRLPEDPARDRDLMRRVQRLEAEYHELLASVPPGEPPAEVRRIGWMIEELRVSYFAQSLGTPYRVSPERISRAMDDLCQ